MYTSLMATIPATKVSVEEYLALDRTAEIPSEYYDGELFPLAAVSVRHSIISANIVRMLGNRLEKTPCRVANSPLRVRVSPTKYVIPDMMVICGKPVLTDEYQDTVTNPKVIGEVLSPSTADYDYGEKFILFRKLESFEEYLLVAQDRARVEVFHKKADKHWAITTYEGLDAVVNIESLTMSLPMTEIYSGVELNPKA